MKFELRTKAQGEVLAAYSRSRARVSFIMGPLGSGKTFESCQKLIRLMCEQKPDRQRIRKTRFYAVRNTYPDLLGTTMKDWMEIFGDLGRYKGGGIEPPCHYLNFTLRDKTSVKSELIFLALDRPQAIKKLRGSQATGFWLNEVKELDKAIVDMADLRHGRYPRLDVDPTWHGMIGDTNAPDDDHWYCELEQNTKPKGWEFFRQPGGLMREYKKEGGRQVWTGVWLPNPEAENINNLDKDYYTTGQEGKNDNWIANMLANEYGTVFTGMAIYKEQWNEDLHVSDKIRFIPDLPLAIGLDFGLTPSAIIGQLTARGKINILEEVVSKNMGINQFVKTLLKPLLKNKYKCIDKDIDQVVEYIGDPAGDKREDTDENTVFKELQSLGIEAYEANTNDTEVRWEAVRFYLEQMRDGLPAFQVHPRCRMIIKGFNGGYQRRRLQVSGEAKYSEKADKNDYSHPHDALQYLMMFYRDDYNVPSSIEFNRPDIGDRWAL